MLLPHNKVSGGVQDSQIMIPSFFDRFYVMPPLTNGVHYTVAWVNCKSKCTSGKIEQSEVCLVLQTLSGWGYVTFFL